MTSKKTYIKFNYITYFIQMLFFVLFITLSFAEETLKTSKCPLTGDPHDVEILKISRNTNTEDNSFEFIVDIQVKNPLHQAFFDFSGDVYVDQQYTGRRELESFQLEVRIGQKDPIPPGAYQFTVKYAKGTIPGIGEVIFYYDIRYGTGEQKHHVCQMTDRLRF
ncbi:hypothetical protein EIN_462540 [Entamoeba invadens IP1]|uniref:MD-2-related lipid-recognition domain-containing protein n=1 Tax=Entamoeba invadens IP1 TaxID=370355 RepID=A0A0A1U675_ENTIV|nr:hypothetical protein EIN_462540 [Entamoeba invadens IP1]ELP89888.1 hypothetical protein EIN_462540 [Entamoeba invadens IP1]|eukprot:XP_004256659.1 hypothetical protein EIN_462540 [Entamoeba invadens IP1]